MLVAACLVLGGTAVPAGRSRQQAPQRNPQQPTFRTGVNAVRVDVIVSDRQGMPVDDLTTADFDLTEDGKPQKIESLKLIRVQTREMPGGEAPRAIRSFDDEATELARDDVRIIVIFLDDYHVSRAAAMGLRPWLRRFVETQVGPYDLVALMYPLTPTAGITFTRDTFALASVIDKFDGRRGDYMPRNDLEANYAMEQPWRIEQIRGEVVMSALKSLSYHLGSLNEGRKSVLVVAESLVTDTMRMRDVIDAANRNNVALYPLDPGGLQVGSFGASDTLRALADNTNGHAIANRNDLGEGLGAVLRDSSAYYLLGYNSDKGADGKFHEIKVRVKKPALEVRARKGYWAPTAEEAAKASEPPRPAAPPAVTNALGSLAEPRGRVIRTWVGVARGEGGRTRVTFVWEPIAPAPGAGPGDRAARVVLVASASNGATAFSGPVPDARPVDKGAAGPRPRAAAAQGPSRAVFDAPAGKLQMKMTVEDPSSQVLESLSREINVPDLTGPQVMLSTPAVLCAHTAREFRALASDPDAVPAASRQFSRTDRLLIRVDAYWPGLAPPAVTARLLNRNGDPMTALTVQAGAERRGAYTIDLPLATLPRGEYLIEIGAKGETGEATAMVAIRITG